MRSAGFIGMGTCLPPDVRFNNDPIFAREKSGGRFGDVRERDLFVGVKTRRVIAPDSAAEDLMVAAGHEALRKAGIGVERIQRLYGYASPSQHVTPNGLYKVHHDLGMRSDAWVIPVHSDFTNFLTGAALAAEAIEAGRCDYAMIACGAAWTRLMDYSQPHAWSIGDGAFAAVMGVTDHCVWLGHAFDTQSAHVNSMTLQMRPGEMHPTYRIHDEGVAVFLSCGMQIPPRLMQALMARFDVAPEQLALVTHQASERLMNHWAEILRPKEYLSTLATLGNMTLATVGVTLALQYESIRAPYIGCLALGAGSHFAAAMLRR